jgi:uncharacterized membrane protein YgcG
MSKKHVYSMVTSTVWSRLQYGHVYSMVTSTVWSRLQYGHVYSVVLMSHFSVKRLWHAVTHLTVKAMFVCSRTWNRFSKMIYVVKGLNQLLATMQATAASNALQEYSYVQISEKTLARCLILALRVPVVGELARANGARLGSREANSTALCVESSATSSRSSRSSRGRSCGRPGDGDHGGGLSNNGRSSNGSNNGRCLLLSRSSATATACGTASPDGWARHGERLAAVVDAEVGVRVGSLVRAGKLVKF